MIERILNELVQRDLHQQCILGLALALGVVALIFSRSLAAFFGRYFREKSWPIDLAIFRLLIFGGLLWMPPRVGSFLDLPPQMRNPLPGWGPFFHLIPFDHASFDVAFSVFQVACWGAFVGLLTRPCAAVVVVLGVYLHGIPQFYGKVIQYPHLFWFAALLAVSPSGRVLSIDGLIARFRGRRRDLAPSVAYGLPLRFAWLLLGCVYLFPGLYKLWRLGPRWAGAENLRNTIWMVWAERPEFVPPLRIDQIPLLLHVAGWGVLVFEIGYVVLVLFRRTRILAAVMATSFHVGMGIVLNILFWPLIICQLSLLPFGDWLHRGHQPAGVDDDGATQRSPSSWRGTAVLGSVLLGLALVFGAGRIYSWPFTCYPCFDFKASATRLIVGVEARREDGQLIPLANAAAAAKIDPARWFQLLRKAARVEDPAERKARLLAIWETLAEVSAGSDEAAVLTFFKLRQSNEPGHVGEEVARLPLLTLRLP